MRLALGALAGIVGVVALGVGLSFATPQMLAPAKKAGFPANNCQYCHNSAVPTKDAFKPEDLNDRGKFLRDDMKARNLKTPDFEKLKEFKATK